MLLNCLSKKFLPALLLAVGFSCSFSFAQEHPVNVQNVTAAEKLLGLEFTPAQRDSLQDDLKDYLEGYESVREADIPNGLAPAFVFDPRPEGFTISKFQQPINWQLPEKVKLPKDLDELAYYSVGELAYLIKNKKISSVELTKFFLERLKTYGDTLECVVTITEERALAKAKEADAAIARGEYKGPLHGIPYGAKDLFAVAGYPTTWGAMPYKDQMIDGDATVIQKLDEAGAILVAKLTLGALAWGDVWFGGVTKNPWNLLEGSSGSSAGSASAVAAGLVPFALGTETLGSIVSPSTRCATTGLRPTYGRVSREGAMALSWTMDKIGPIARSAEDCALVFNVIRGADPGDDSTVDAPFNYQPQKPLSALRIGYLKEAFEADYPNRPYDSLTLVKLREMGAELHEVNLPQGFPLDGLSVILSAEAAAAFDDLTLSDQDTMLVRQIKNAWPNVFRAARFIPAVEYIQANRIRQALIKEMHEVMKDYDVVVTPTYGGAQLFITNLTGHPCVVVPNGLNEDGTPANMSISFIGPLYGEAGLLNIARAYQQATKWDEMHPPLFSE
ncbi:amidase [Nafulsella turpanensis]|uniref:amidase n=1 Tax=Nafulsella turpanensis TaxID=1265690 RepID=UPI0003494FD9|nr:amidase [Nafulsella turpanensis]